MSKRTAASELNRDNWDTEDDKEELGSFNRASGDALKNRVIRKAKRSLTSNSSDGAGISPFAAFSGFVTSSTPSSFAKKTIEFPNIENNQPKTQNNDVTKNGGASVDNSNQSEKPLSCQTENNNSTKTRNIEYYRQLQSLNEGVLKWMELHLSKNKCCDFTPVFNDYTKHLETLNLTYPVQKKGDEVKETTSIKSSFTDFTSKSNDSNSSSKISLPENANKDETDYGNNFSARPTNTSTYSCGIKPALTATSSSTPTGPTSSSKEGEKTEKTENTFKFSFGNKISTGNTGFSSGFSFASAIAAQKTEQAKSEEETYEPPKNEFVAVTEEDAIYSKKCKLFFKKGDTYADKGVGMLHLKSVEGKTQLLVRADTNLGNILLNIMLSASLPMSRTGKNNVLLVCVPNPPIDAKNPDEAIPMLIRVKTAEDADELLEILNKHKT